MNNFDCKFFILLIKGSGGIHFECVNVIQLNNEHGKNSIFSHISKLREYNIRFHLLLAMSKRKQGEAQTYTATCLHAALSELCI